MGPCRGPVHTSMRVALNNQQPVGTIHECTTHTTTTPLQLPTAPFVLSAPFLFVCRFLSSMACSPCALDGRAQAATAATSLAAARIGGNGRHVLDAPNLDARARQRPQRALAA